nr:hypothetical protein [Tanacetum cinerariifolium]
TISKRARKRKSIRRESSSSQVPNLVDKVREFRMFNNNTHQGSYDNLHTLPIHSGTIVNWSFFVQHGLANSFFESINNDPFSVPQWVNLFQINKLVYRELVHEFFASFEFKNHASKGNPKFKGVSFRLGGEYMTMSLLELGWRIGLYSEENSLNYHRCSVFTLLNI